MKKIYFIFISIIVLLTIFLLIFNDKEKVTYIEYNGFKLALLVDGEEVNSMPIGNYFLVDYICSNGTVFTWNYDNSTLTSDNYNISDICSLTFESSPKLYDLVNIGDYISYTGNNGCSGNQCSGWNANQTNTDIYDNYGYCFTSELKFNTYGWRVLYKNDNSVYIVSAGAPECVKASMNNSSSTINSIKSTSLNYCNTSYLSDGVCDVTTAHAFNGDDFYKFTSQYYGIDNAWYLHNYNDGGTYGEPYCLSKYSNHYCGYSDGLIDNGGYYWFANANGSRATVFWNQKQRFISSTTGLLSSGKTYSNGVRQVLKLDASVMATGGAGTMENPYTISTRSGV